MGKTSGGTAERLTEPLAKLGEFCSVFETEGLKNGEVRDSKPDSKGIIQLPYFELSKAADSFERHCYEHGWVLDGFDWSEWMTSAEARELRDNREKLAEASPDQLAKLLTLLIRQERFCDGTMAEAYESGLLLTILRRAKALGWSKDHNGEKQ
jgi:hypothetical protein